MNHIPRILRHALAALLAATLATSAQAWWNKDWTHRTRIVVNTTTQGAETKEAASAVPLAVRLHSGNFDFAAAKEDGADLRIVAGDDKTPLPYRIERFDGINELAVVWVQLPTVAPGSDKNVVYAYSGNPKAAAENAAATGFDAATLAALHFTAADGSDASGTLKSSAPIAVEPNGLLAGALKLNGSAVRWPANDKLRVPADGAMTVSLWIKPDAVAQGVLLQQGPLQLALAGGKLSVQVGKATLQGGDVKPATWTHVALSLGQGKATLYQDGAQVAQADAATPAIDGELKLGEGLSGAADELEIASTVRTPAWIALAAASQGVSGKLVQSTMESGEESGGGHGYFGILFANLTLDAWVVIVILGVMFLIAAAVMVGKAMFIRRTDRDNRSFLSRFRDASHDMLHLEQGGAHPHSSLYRLYQAGVRELAKREESVKSASLSGASLDAVKAAVDADMVRETHRLNAQMVMLTIAISGGPFLGLLGTVVGVMITFAAIAAAGDVNVNAIAPGIAAALLATVAGLGVAIPSLFGYNYLASRIKNISADMQIFVDEFITRVAETYGAR